MAQGSLHLLGNVRGWAGLQDGDGDEVLCCLPLVAGDQMIRHSTQIMSHLVVRLVITPSGSHHLLVLS